MPLLLLIFCLFWSFPAAAIEFSRFYPSLEQQVAQKKYDQAIRQLKKSKSEFSGNHQVLYQLEMGMLLHLAGRYQESNRLLHAAEDAMEDFYTTSVSSEITAFLTNDLNRPFEGEDFEKVLVNLISALNYSLLGQPAEALVEARKVDHKLGLLEARLENEKTKNAYRQDAFARYLSGMLYASMQEWNDAYIAYQKAFEGYQSYRRYYQTEIPPNLGDELLRLSTRLGLKADRAKWAKAFPKAKGKAIPPGYGEVVVLNYNGLIPIKKPKVKEIFVHVLGAPYLMKISFPYYLNRANPVAYAQLRLQDAKGKSYSGQSFVVENISAIALRDLRDRIDRIESRAIAQATTKFVAIKALEMKANDDYGFLGGLAVGLAGNIWAFQTDKIDDRGWRFLPGEVQMTRLWVPPGKYQVEVEYFSSQGRSLGAESLEQAEVKPKRVTYLKTRESPSSGFDPDMRLASRYRNTPDEEPSPISPGRAKSEKTNRIELSTPLAMTLNDSRGQAIPTQSQGGIQFSWIQWGKELDYHWGVGFLTFSSILPNTNPDQQLQLGNSYFTFDFRMDFTPSFYGGVDLGLGSSWVSCASCNYSSQGAAIGLLVFGLEGESLGGVLKLGPYSGSATAMNAQGGMSQSLTWSGTLATLGVTYKF